MPANNMDHNVEAGADAESLLPTRPVTARATRWQTALALVIAAGLIGAAAVVTRRAEDPVASPSVAVPVSLQVPLPSEPVTGRELLVVKGGEALTESAKDDGLKATSSGDAGSEKKDEENANRGVFGKSLNDEDFTAAMGKFLKPVGNCTRKQSYLKIMSTLTSRGDHTKTLSVAETHIPMLVDLMGKDDDHYTTMMVATLLIELAQHSKVRQIAMRNAGATVKCREILGVRAKDFPAGKRAVEALFTVLMDQK